jgi:hypothetical protein
VNFIFTDIDGVLNTVNRNQWNKTSVDLYNSLCDEFDLKPIVTSTWRVKHTIEELQKIFYQNGITTPIYDYTPVLLDEGRGGEIEYYIFNNNYDKFIILDDNIRDIQQYGLPNVVKCRSWVGFSKEEYDLAREILSR